MTTDLIDLTLALSKTVSATQLEAAHAAIGVEVEALRQTAVAAKRDGDWGAYFAAASALAAHSDRLQVLTAELAARKAA